MARSIPRRLDRLPRRVGKSLKLLRLTANWRQLFRSQLAHTRLPEIRLRTGLSISGPPELDLRFLFEEIWIQEVYSGPGYEIRPNSAVVDVGASIGVFALYAATRHPTVLVLACEPYLPSYQWLCRNVAENRLPNIRTLPFAVAGSRGQRRLSVHPTNWLLHSLDRDAVGPPVPVDCVDLAQLLEYLRPPACDLLKLDCEGSEHEILEACDERTLQKVQRIVAEYHRSPDGRRDGHTLRNFLETRGYAVDRFEETGDGAGYLAARRRE